MSPIWTTEPIRKLIALTASAFVLLLVLSSTAFAQDDDFNLGDGHEGAVTLASNSVPNAVAPVADAISAGSTAVTLGSVVNNDGTSGSIPDELRRFEGGRLVMIFQPNGYPSVLAPSGGQSTIDLSNSNVGRWELARISGSEETGYGSGSTITFTKPIVNDFSDAAIIVTIPEFTSVTINDSVSATATAWDGTRGGVVGFLASGEITMGAGSRISAAAMGFRLGAAAGTSAGACTGLDDPDGGRKGEGIAGDFFGPTFVSRGNRANGAGGGNCENAGGGGGGNAGQGGIGGDTYSTNLPGGLGGTKLSYSAEDHAVFGGGGGGGQQNNFVAGDGGNGGGFVFLRGASLSGAGTLDASGGAGADSAAVGPSDGAGGGGAGGVIHARFSGSAVCSSIYARGGAGGDERSDGGVHGPGGGGGGGRIYFERGDGDGCASVSAVNGLAGVATNGGSTRNAEPSTTTDSLYTGVTETPIGAFARPSVAITSPAAGSTVNGVPTLSGTGSPDGATVFVYEGADLLGTAVVASGDWSLVPSTALTDGSHTVTVKSRYRGVWSDLTTAITRTFTVDTTPPDAPTLVRTAPANSPSNSTAATITYGDIEPGATVECSTDAGDTWTACAASPIDLTGLTEGTQSYSIRQTDAVGNVGSVATVTWTIDLTAPEAPTVTRTAPESSPSNSTSATISYAAAEVGGAMECSTDGSTWTECAASPVTLTDLTDGAQHYFVRQVDAAGNSGSVGSVSWTVDTVAPSAPGLSSNRTGTVGEPTATMTFTPSEVGGTLECSLDGGTFTTCSSPVDYLDLSDGAHEFEVRQVDEAGNVGAQATHSWTVDTTPPNAPTLNGPNPHTNNREATVSFAGSPDTVELRCSFNGGSFSACPTSPLTLGELPDGNYSFSVQAFDAVGNSSTSTISWEVDTVAPATPTITAGPIGSVPSPDAQFSFTGAEAGGIFRCNFGAQPAVTCASPFDITGLSDGTYTFRVRQVDAAGNVGPLATRIWTVDTTPPPTPTITGPASPSGQTSAVIDFSDTEAGVTFRCAVDGGPFTVCTNSLALSSLADGSHTVAVRASDAAGNGSATASFTWSVDHNLFTADISGAPSAVVNSTNASMTLSASLPGSTFQCSLDGAAFSTCTSPISISGLAEGPHSFKLRASKGEQTAPEVTRGWTIDLTNPSVTITAPAPASDSGAEASVAFVASDLHAPITTTCKLDSAAAAPCMSPQTYTNLSEGNHTVVVVATDAAGNSGTATRTWHVDRTAPIAQLTGGPTEGGQSNDDTPTFTFANNEPGSFECSIDGGEFALCASPFTLPALDDGGHTFAIHAFDQSGNESNDVTRKWIVDTAAPSAPSIDEPSSETVLDDGTPTVSGNAESAEPNSTLAVYVDGDLSGTTTVASDGAWSFTVAVPLSDGSYAFTAKATDAAGNGSPVSNTVIIHIEGRAPTAQITSKPGALSNDTTPTFSFTADEPAAFECRIDGGEYAACSSPFTAATLADGAHTFLVRAIDASGNHSGAETWDWTIDTSAPTVTVTADTPPAGVSPTFSFNSIESPGTTYKCRIDGVGAFTTCSSPFNAPTLPGGDHTLEVQYTDAAGNTGVNSVSFTVTAPATAQPPKTDPPALVPPTTPPVESCAGANVTLKSAVARKNNVVEFTTGSDKDILIRVSIYDGKKLLGTSVRANDAGKAIIAVKTEKDLPNDEKFTIRLSAVTMAGGKSVADGEIATEGNGGVTLLGAPIASTVDCAPAKGAKKVTVKLSAVSKVTVGSKTLSAMATSSDWTVATVRVIQGGETIGSKVQLLKPGKKSKIKIKLLSGAHFAKGSAVIHVATYTVEGVQQLLKKPITVK